jgi:hypothetical protein
MNAPTPETDAHMLGGSYSFDVEFARRLERERDESRKLLRDANRGAERNAHISQSLASQLVDARRELDEASDVIKQCHFCISLFLGWHSRDLGMDHLRYVSETLAKCANQLNHSSPATSLGTT